MRRAHLPVPARDGGPVFRRGKAQGLHFRRERRHRRLGERLRHVAGFPRETRAAAAQRTVRETRHGLAEGMAHDRMAHGACVGLVDADDRPQDGIGEFQQQGVGPGPLHARLARAAAIAHVADFADGQPRNGAADLLVQRIVDVGGGGRIVRRHLERAPEVHRPRNAVRADDLDELDGRVAISERDRKRHRRVGAAALFGEDLDPFVIPERARAVGFVCGMEAVVQHHGIGVGEALRRYVRRRENHLVRIGQAVLRHGRQLRRRRGKDSRHQGQKE